ncbi:MAG: right-handed parallel beta-helix repeat-containing protein, partial [Candidatus Micrarchaeota archaeon]|nr:right-handed parallel beta-helix repeat-containing protein [Candidatus Micrarchaeota archaeon]
GSDNSAPGIWVDIHDNATIRNCNVSHFEYGIRLYYSNSSTVTNNSISGASSSGGGIVVDYGYNTTITYNNVTSNDAPGIHMSATYANVSNNNVSFNEAPGIQTEGGSNSTFSYNTLDHNQDDGIDVNDDGYSVVSNNVIKNTHGGSFVHSIISRGDSEHTAIMNNVVVNGGMLAIQVESYYGNITNNTVNDSAYGITISGKGLATMRNNSMNGNTGLGLFIYCGTAECYDNDIDTSNTANGEPIYYLNHKTNYVLENLQLTAANTSLVKILVANSDNVTIRNVVIANNQGGGPFGSIGTGVALFFANNSVVSNVTVSGCIGSAGFYIGGSGNTVEDCTATNNKYGVQITASGQTVSNCNITGNTRGIQIEAGNQSISGNNITGNSAYNIYTNGAFAWSLSGGGTSIQYSSLSTSGDISDAVYYAGTGVAAVNASANNDLNTSAQITMAITGQCPTVNLYYYNDFTTDLNTIIASGQLCNSTSTPACNIVSCSGSTVVFNVDHFDSYGGEGYSIPEFSQLAAVAALLLAAGGYAVARKRK